MNKKSLRTFLLRNLEYILLSLILVFALVSRIYKINSPIADWHSWRQADTASVTRTYVNEGIDPLFPRYHDVSSIQTGIYNPKGLRLVEFPVFNIIHALLTKNFPFLSLEVWGRLVSVFSALASTVFVYLLGKKFIGGWGGIIASFFFAFIPYNIYFTRVVLPEPMAVAFGLAGIWLFVRFIDGDKLYNLILSGLLLAVSFLIKPFTFFYLIPIIYLYHLRHGLGNILKNAKLLIRSLIFLNICLVPFSVWRVWVNQYPAGIPHFLWAFNGDKIRFRPAFWRWIFGERLGRLILGIWGVVPFAFGIIKQKNQFINAFLVGMLLYVSILATASVRHDYYQIIIIPAVSLALSQGVINMWNPKGFNKILTRVLAVFSILIGLGIGAYQIKDFYRINHPEIVEAGNALDKLAPKDALVIAPYNGDTAFLYQTKRWGWPVIETSLEETIEKGASFYVSVNFADPDTPYAMTNYKVVEKTDRYVIVDLRERKNE